MLSRTVFTANVRSCKCQGQGLSTFRFFQCNIELGARLAARAAQLRRDGGARRMPLFAACLAIIDLIWFGLAGRTDGAGCAAGGAGRRAVGRARCADLSLGPARGTPSAGPPAGKLSIGPGRVTGARSAGYRRRRTGSADTSKGALLLQRRRVTSFAKECRAWGPRPAPAATGGV